MSNQDEILKYAEGLIYQSTDAYCTQLQRQILTVALSDERKTYDQLAEENSYSPSYVKQDVAPKLWQTLSRALNQKVTKMTVRAVLKREWKNAQIGFSQGLARSEPRLSLPDEDVEVGIDTEQPLSGATILLVDDQPKNLKLLSDLLEEQGYEVQQAINGKIALEAVNANPPDLLLLDIHMPELDGYGVCQKLKINPSTRNIPVVFISAMDDAWDKVKAFSVGGNDYITKPFNVVEVLARVENQLKITQLQQSLRAQNVQLQQAIRELKRLAALDELTQLASRRRFDGYLHQQWQRTQEEKIPLTLLLIHIDHFIFYRDGEDSERGDRYLSQVAQVFKEVVQGPETLIARLGALNFAILLPYQPMADALQVAQTLQTRVQKLKIPVKPALSLSVGIVETVPSSDVGIEGFIDACDRRLQQAKTEGGNCVISS